MAEAGLTGNSAPYTAEVTAWRFLNEGRGEAMVKWAESMVLSGFDSPALFILLGETAPFNAFEMNELFDRAAFELGLPAIKSDVDAVLLLASVAASKFISSFVSPMEALDALLLLPWGIPEIPREKDLLLDILAYTDQYGLREEQQDAEADRLLRAFHTGHPMHEWSSVEWSKASQDDDQV